jgi:hypothetical protein
VKWIPASEKPAHDVTQVLICYWGQFFGYWDLLVDVGHYDDPADYNDGSGKGWCLWESERAVKCAAWMPLPELPEYPKQSSVSNPPPEVHA